MELVRDTAPPPEATTDGSPVTDAPSFPRPPESLEEAGLPLDLVTSLILKALHARGASLGFDLVDLLALPMALLDEGIQALQDLRLVEVHETRGPRRGEYVFKLTTEGRRQAQEELEACRYVGPAPVPFDDFLEWVELQAIERARVSEDELRSVLDGVVLPDDMVDLLGPAINSGRSLFLYGGPGDGKTFLAERIASVFGDRYFVPFAVLVDGSVMIVYDPVLHREYEAPEALRETPAEVAPLAEGPDGGDAQPDEPDVGPADVGEDAPDERTGGPVLLDDEMLREIVRAVPDHDRRYAVARRPVVVTGGELTLEQLDLQWDPAGRMYQAPPQLKAAGGVLLIDDLGRQRVPVRELLNRWVVPLEHRRDYLTLRSGRKLVVPFDCFVIFSTNLEPESLADEAFLRRIHYKIEIPGTDRAEYARIFQACCDDRGITFHERALDYLFDEFYAAGAIEPRRCHPRDLLDHLCDIAAYRGEEAYLTPKLLEHAGRSYFLTPG